MNEQLTRFCASAFLAGLVVISAATNVLCQPACRPNLIVKDVNFSPMQPPTMQRKWTARVSVDASRCAAHSTGTFEIVFTRLQEFGPDTQSSENFIWAAPDVAVAVTLAPTEAVQDYRIGRVTACRCAGE